MARQLGVSSQLYGMYERGEREPGASFFVAWRRLFGDDLTGEFETIVPHETVSVTNKKEGAPGSEPVYLKEYIQSLIDHKRILEEQNQFLRRNFELSLNSISTTQHALLVQLKTLAWYQADTLAGGDENKLNEELQRLGNKAAELAGVTEKTDSPTGN